MGRRYRFVVNFILTVAIVYSAIPLYFFLTGSSRGGDQRRIDNLIAYENDFSADLKYSPGVQLIPENEFGDMHDGAEKALEQKKKLLVLESELRMKQSELDRLGEELKEEQRTRKQLEVDLANAKSEVATTAASQLPKSAGSSEKDQKSAQITKKFYSSLPASSVYCYGSTKKDRVCRFKNLYFSSDTGAFFIVINRMSVINNVPLDRSPALLDLTSLDDHGVFYFNYEQLGGDALKDQTVTVVEKLSFIFDRFHVGNIMHSLHDDIIALYHDIRHFQVVDTSKGQPDFASFSLDHHLWLFEGFGAGDYGHLFELFSDHPLKFKSDADTAGIMCFQDAVVGQTKLANWYHYGFFEPQGPIQPKNISGHHVRQVADFIRYRLGLGDLVNYGDGKQVSSAVKKPDGIAIFSRTRDRLILNEVELKDSLSNRFKMPAQFLRMENHSFRAQVEILSTTKIAIGMHGSMLIMGMFLPRSSILIELYPYAVPGDNYTPYRTMSKLPGMDIIYRKWENIYPDNNIMHPDRSLYQGGINHLSASEQEKILNTPTVPKHTCCTNPYWLFRIYQDTKVHIEEVTGLIEAGLRDSKEIEAKPISGFGLSITPARIRAASIKCEPLFGDGKVKSVRITWDAPWNGVKVERYSIWEHLSYSEHFSASESITIEHNSYQVGATLQVWVRSIYQGKTGPYSDKAECQLNN